MGCIYVSFSSHESAYGRLPIPIYSLKGGSGPTVLLMAGNHGDEYEGQLALMRWLGEVNPSRIAGQVIVLPHANFPAAAAGRRTSPIDQGNLNRSFGGDPDESITQKLAHFIEHELIAQVDVLVDLHSGGSSLTYIPSTLVFEDHYPSDQFLEHETVLMQKFGTPVGLRMCGFPGLDTTSVGAAHRHGVLGVCTELGGGATVSPVSLAFAKAGIHNVLAHLGMMDADPDASATARTLTVRGLSDFVYAPEPGLFEPLVDLGSEVVEGQPVGHLWFPRALGRKPRVVVSPGAGWVVCKRHPVAAEAGDCLLHLAGELATEGVF
jgi:uncharacterized protein